MRSLSYLLLAALCITFFQCTEDDPQAMISPCSTRDCYERPPILKCNELYIAGGATTINVGYHSNYYTMFQWWGLNFGQLKSRAYHMLYNPPVKYSNGVMVINTAEGELRLKVDKSYGTITYHPYSSTYLARAYRVARGSFRYAGTGQVIALRSVFKSSNYEYKISRASFTSSPPYTVILEQADCPSGSATNAFLAAISLPFSMIP